MNPCQQEGVNFFSQMLQLVEQHDTEITKLWHENETEVQRTLKTLLETLDFCFYLLSCFSNRLFIIFTVISSKPKLFKALK